MKRREDSELAVITKAKDLCSYVFVATASSPKSFRFSFVSRMQNLALDVVECTMRANDVYVARGDAAAHARRRELQGRALSSVKLLCYVGMLAMEQCCILPRQYEHLARLGTDCRNILGAWIAGDNKRFSPQAAAVGAADTGGPR